jgi:three-Cys-motif partner protein
MPKINGIGLSEYTDLKQRVFFNLIKQNIVTVDAICKKKNWSNYRYLYIDATSGNGWYEGIKGSPLQFWDAINSLKRILNLEIRAYFIEQNKNILNELNDNLPPNCKRNSILIHGKYCDCIPSIYKSEGSNFGILYIDPNGIIDFEFLTDISKTRYMKMTDILLNCNATSIKRTRKAFNNIDELINLIKRINKKRWFVSEYRGPYQWAFFLGTNSKNFIPHSNGIKFYDISSDFGERILHKLNYTKEEYSKNLPHQRNLEEIGVL